MKKKEHKEKDAKGCELKNAILSKKTNIYSVFADSDEEVESISNETKTYIEEPTELPIEKPKEKVKFCWADECD
jgi:hypothetical protein